MNKEKSGNHWSRVWAIRMSRYIAPQVSFPMSSQQNIEKKRVPISFAMAALFGFTEVCRCIPILSNNQQ
jgi:hypothetical protein